VHGAWLKVESEQRVYRARAPKAFPSIAAGDRVTWTMQRDVGWVESLEPRDSLLYRPNEDGSKRPLAANLDRVLVVAAPQPITSARFVDRYLVNLELQDHRVTVVLQKVDMLDEESSAYFETFEARYRTIGYDVLRVSAHSGEGMDALIDRLRDRCSIMVGQSGVGKSSLARKLIPDINIAVGDLTTNANLGRHTTSNTRVLALPFGGSLIDSPGVRDFATWHLPGTALPDGFPEFTPWCGQCRFRDCRHDKDADCAVRGAVDAGAIARERWEAYIDMLHEIEAWQQLRA
jgi:ribosome biogenesis GTPase / thiamine phosphate phosphatase